VFDGDEEHVGRIGAGRVDHALVAVGLNDRPDHQAVEQSHEDDRRIGGPRDRAFRIFGFGPVERGGLEAHEGGEGEGQHAGHARGENRGRREGCGAESIGSALHDNGYHQQHQDRRLGDQ